jgi:hypothetical protein
MKTSLSVLDTAAAPVPAAFSARQPSTPIASPLAKNWMPCLWNEELMGLIFLPRMLDKGRQVLKGERLGQNLMNGYLFGNFDYADRGMLKFLRTTDARVLELLRASEDSAAVAKILVDTSGRSAAEIAAWNKRFRTLNALFLAMWNADEGRRAPGWGTSCLKVFYNSVLMPPVYLFFRAAQKRSPSAHDRYN